MSAQTRVDHLQQEPSQQTRETLSASSRYINMRAPGVAAASWNSVEAPAIREHVAYGEDQGGILDWFRRIFGMQNQAQTLEPTGMGRPGMSIAAGVNTDTRNVTNEPPAAIVPVQNEQNPQPQNLQNPPVQNPQPQNLQNPPARNPQQPPAAVAHTAGDTWGKTDIVAQYAMSLPKGVGKDVMDQLARPHTEEVKMKPIFETHSFMPREEIDEKGALYMHSFIGLRYTEVNPWSKRLERKIVKVGFGGNGSPFGAGKLMDDGDTQADMSTETPINAGSFKRVVGAIGTVGENIVRVQRGQRQKDGFSGKYNVFTNNCNDFVESMAKIAGASVPERLHHSILGPAGAYKQLAEEAGKGQQGETRFFQGGGIGSGPGGKGQMSLTNRVRFLENFQQEAERALGVDGIKLRDHPQLQELIGRVVGCASLVAGYLAGMADAPQNKDQRDALSEILDQVSVAVRALVETDTGTSHPRLNISAMKVEALARIVRNMYLPPEERKLGNLTPMEENLALTMTTQAESEAANLKRRDPNAPVKIENTKLFNFRNMEENNSYSAWAAGDLLLQAAGIDDVGDFISQLQTGRVDLIPVNLIHAVTERIRGTASPEFNRILGIYIDARSANTPRQNAMLISQAIVKRLGLDQLEEAMMNIAALRDRTTGQVVDGFQHMADVFREEYVSPSPEEMEASPATITRKKETRRMHLVASSALEEIILEKIEALNRQQTEAA